MTPEQQWQAAVILAKQLAKKPTALDKAIIWADDRIKTLEEENKKLRDDIERVEANQYHCDYAEENESKPIC